MPSTSPALGAAAGSPAATTLVDAWYADALRPFGASDLDTTLAARFSPAWLRLAQRLPALRGVLWFLVSRGAERIVSPFSARGLPVMLLLHRLLSPRPPRLYLVEFLRGEPQGRVAHLKEMLHVACFAALLPRLLARAQVMTPWEAQAYAAKYRLPRERFCFIAFPMVRQPSWALADWQGEPRQVLASGRAACDWPTLLSAARGATWPLTIVCSAADRPAVDALNTDGRARVLSEISHEAHQGLLDRAAVYALVLREQRASSGQVRLARAIEAGVPVVATRVQGLDGYLEAGTTGMAVPLGDAAGLRAAIDRLLDDAAWHATLRQRAHAAMRERSLEAYVDRIRAFVFDDSAAAAPEPGADATRMRVAFCGPIGAVGQPAGGGYESANRRNCDALARRGLTVTELPYPKVTAQPVQRLLRYAASYARAAWHLLARRAQYDLLHITPLNMHFAFAETLLISCARWAGKPVLLDVRAGTFVRHYEAAGPLYRRTIDRSVRSASRVAVEGQTYIPFMRQRSRMPVLHLPNYVDSPALQRRGATAPAAGGPVRLIYFGRLVAEKGIETALDALALLNERGVQAELELVGDGPSAYLAALRERHAHLPVHWSGTLTVEAILQRAEQAHFFVFASRHDGEGHSNALNEAMSLGLVPICSEQGFTRSVVGNAGVVLPVRAEAPAYADAIEEIVVQQRWAMLSERARTRVRTQFSEDAAIPALIDTYRSMLHAQP